MIDKSRPRVLIVDDQDIDRKLLERIMMLEGYDATSTASGRDALSLVGREVFDLVMLDRVMPEMGGIEVLRQLKRQDPAADVIMLTADPTVETAVEALQAGAFDYLAKPVNQDELRHRLGRLRERAQLREEVQSLRSRLGEELTVRGIVGTSPAIQAIKEIINKVAMTDSSVLIEGESGTGKELVAAAVHRLSARHASPFVPVNCGSIPADLMESEFFGHVRGAFSGAVADAPGLFRSAHGGTLFLDEIGELPPALQVKLLRVLQDKEVRPVGSTKTQAVDVRVVAATNRGLDEAVRAGTIRADLFYRLSVVRVLMPPLRERKADLAALVTHFIRQFNHRFARSVRGITEGAMLALLAYDFPGNVRELENLIERAYALGARDEITLDDLPALAPRLTTTPPDGDVPRLTETLGQVERDLIARALQLHAGDKEKAARALGVSPRTLYRRLKEHGLEHGLM